MTGSKHHMINDYSEVECENLSHSTFERRKLS